MGNKKRIIKVIKYSVFSLLGIFAVLVIAFIIYLQVNKMKPAVAFTLNSPAMEKKLLIATQGSRFKDALTRKIANQIAGNKVFIKVEDVTFLQNASENDWKAILIINSCEMNKLHKSVQHFLSKSSMPQKIILLATSGPGTWKPKNVTADTISSASKMNKIDSLTGEITEKLKKILGE